MRWLRRWRATLAPTGGALRIDLALARWRSWDKELVDQIGQMAKDVFFQAHRSDGMAPLQLAAMQGDGS